MMKKTTKLTPLKRHKRSQNTGIAYTLADEATVVESPMRFPPIRFRCAAATAASVVAVHFRAVRKLRPRSRNFQFCVVRCRKPLAVLTFCEDIGAPPGWRPRRGEQSARCRRYASPRAVPVG